MLTHWLSVLVVLVHLRRKKFALKCTCWAHMGYEAGKLLQIIFKTLKRIQIKEYFIQLRFFLSYNLPKITIINSTEFNFIISWKIKSFIIGWEFVFGWSWSMSIFIRVNFVKFSKNLKRFMPMHYQALGLFLILSCYHLQHHSKFIIFILIF